MYLLARSLMATHTHREKHEKSENMHLKWIANFLKKKQPEDEEVGDEQEAVFMQPQVDLQALLLVVESLHLPALH